MPGSYIFYQNHQHSNAVLHRAMQCNTTLRNNNAPRASSGRAPITMPFVHVSGRDTAAQHVTQCNTSHHVPTRPQRNTAQHYSPSAASALPRPDRRQLAWCGGEGRKGPGPRVLFNNSASPPRGGGGLTPPTHPPSDPPPHPPTPAP